MPELEEEDLFEFLANSSSQNDPVENFTLKDLTEKLASAIGFIVTKKKDWSLPFTIMRISI